MKKIGLLVAVGACVAFLHFVVYPVLKNLTFGHASGVHSVDLRTGLNKVEGHGEQDRYYLVFQARGGSPTGHAYVVWGEESSAARASIQACYGIVPAGSNPKRMAFGDIKAIFRTSDCTVPGTWNSLIVEVDKAAFNSAFNVYWAWKGRPTKIADDQMLEVFRNGQREHEQTSRAYQLLSADCLQFMIEVARTVPGLKVPTRRAQFPVDYVDELIALNG